MGDHLGIAGAIGGCKISAKTNMKAHPRELGWLHLAKNTEWVYCALSFNRFPQSVLALLFFKTHTCCSMSFKKVSSQYYWIIKLNEYTHNSLHVYLGYVDPTLNIQQSSCLIGKDYLTDEVYVWAISLGWYFTNHLYHEGVCLLYLYYRFFKDTWILLLWRQPRYCDTYIHVWTNFHITHPHTSLIHTMSNMDYATTKCLLWYSTKHIRTKTQYYNYIVNQT